MKHAPFSCTELCVKTDMSAQTQPLYIHKHTSRAATLQCILSRRKLILIPERCKLQGLVTKLGKSVSRNVVTLNKIHSVFLAKMIAIMTRWYSELITCTTKDASFSCFLYKLLAGHWNLGRDSAQEQLRTETGTQNLCCPRHIVFLSCIFLFIKPGWRTTPPSWHVCHHLQTCCQTQATLDSTNAHDAARNQPGDHRPTHTY
jgi:hypothetical protein